MPRGLLIDDKVGLEWAAALLIKRERRNHKVLKQI